MSVFAAVLILVCAAFLVPAGKPFLEVRSILLALALLMWKAVDLLSELKGVIEARAHQPWVDAP